MFGLETKTETQIKPLRPRSRSRAQWGLDSLTFQVVDVAAVGGSAAVAAYDARQLRRLATARVTDTATPPRH